LLKVLIYFFTGFRPSEIHIKIRVWCPRRTPGAVRPRALSPPRET